MYFKRDGNTFTKLTLTIISDKRTRPLITTLDQQKNSYITTHRNIKHLIESFL